MWDLPEHLLKAVRYQSQPKEEGRSISFELNSKDEAPTFPALPASLALPFFALRRQDLETIDSLVNFIS